MGCPQFEAFDQALAAAYPEKFGTSAVPPKRQFTHRFAFPLLEGTVARIAMRHDVHDVSLPEVEASIDDMLRLLERDSEEAVAARIVSNVEVSGSTPLRIGDVEVLGIQGGPRDAAAAAGRILPGVGRDLDQNLRPFPFIFVVSLLVSRRVSVPDPAEPAIRPYYTAAGWASARLRSFVLTLRMATAATVHNIVEAIAPPGWIRLHDPTVTRLDYPTVPLLTRVAKIDERMAASLVPFAERIAGWSSNLDKKPMSLGIAMERFNRSYEEAPWYDQLVDLGVALEASLLDGAENEEISLKLRSRAAALLATDSDSAPVIYQDVKVLYNLRSTIVHGSSMTSSGVQKEFGKISVANRSSAPGVRGELCLDRMRDLVRRAILVRGYLAEAGVWPLSGEKLDVDGQLIDAGERERWRNAWRASLNESGLASAASEAQPALELGRDPLPIEKERDAGASGEVIEPSD